MPNVMVRETYLNTLQTFGDVTQQINVAVEEYVTRRVIDRIKIAREKIGEFESKYSMTYAAFSERMQADETFYQKVDCANPLWEQDTLAWEYWQAEAQEWSEKLDTLLRKS